MAAFWGSSHAQTIYSNDFSKDSIGQQPMGWEIFGAASIGTVQFDTGSTKKIYRIVPGMSNATSYAQLRLQKTLDQSYGDWIFSFKFRHTRLPQATNTSNAGNFVRFGLGGTANVYNNDNNTLSTATTISPLGFQGILRPATGLSSTTGNFTPVSGTWYQIEIQAYRTSDTTFYILGNIYNSATGAKVKDMKGTIKTLTPTIYMNQFCIDLNALYHYNVVDLDSIKVSVPPYAPSVGNLSITGTPEVLQPLRGNYNLSGSDTGGTVLQWLSGPTATGPFTVIPGADSPVYVPQRFDAGKFIAFRVTPRSTSRYVIGIARTVVSTMVQAHGGLKMIPYIKIDGNVAVNSPFTVNYRYVHPQGIAEKQTGFSVFVSDSFNLGYFKLIKKGVTNAANGVPLLFDSTLKGKYVYVELLPQDMNGVYGDFSGWTAQTAVAPEIQVLKTEYWKDSLQADEYGISNGSFTVRSVVRNNRPGHDTLIRLNLQLLDGLGNVVQSAQSPALLLKGDSQATFLTAAVQVPTTFEGMNFKVWFSDTGNTVALAAPEKLAEPEDVNTVYQYFINDGDSSRGAYLWLPPNTKTIKGILICINNNIERQIQENPEIKRIARKWGLASLVLNTFRNSLLAPPNYLSFDFTRPGAAAKMDSIIKALSILSNHPELVNAPFIPMAHSAYMDFPFHVAMRDNTKCIAAIPIKSGVPNIYNYYKVGGSSSVPSPGSTMKDVPILFYQGFLPETVDGLYKTAPFRPHRSSLGAGFTGIYRNDDGTGVYKPGMEFGGNLLELYEGHFNAMPRAMKVLAMFIDKACAARLPDNYPTDPNVRPVLKPLDFAKGWLVDQNYFNARDTTKYAKPAPYNLFKGQKKGSCWYLDEELARTCEQLAVSEYFKQVEQFSINKPDGSTDTLYQCVYNYHPKDGDRYTDSTGIMRLTVTSFDKPWPIDTASANNKDSLKVPMKLSTNVLLPGVATLPITNLPFKTNTKASCYKHLGNLVFRLRFDRFSPSPGGYTQSYVSVYREGNDTVAASLRNIRMDRTQSTMPGLKQQSLVFPEMPRIDVNTRSIALNARASSGLPVSFFVRNGPAVVAGDRLYLSQFHEGTRFPVAIVIGACQYGTTGKNGIYAAGPLYRTLWVDNIQPMEKLNLNGQIATPGKIALSWNRLSDTNITAYIVYRNDREIGTIKDTFLTDDLTGTVGLPEINYYVRSLNNVGNTSDTSNNVSFRISQVLTARGVSLTGRRIEGRNELTWQGFGFPGNVSYTLQSAPAPFGPFSAIAERSSALSTAKFSHLDNDALRPDLDRYYRVAAVDASGKTQLSPTIEMKGTAPMKTIVYPNPSKGFFIVEGSKIDRVTVYGSDGKPRLQRKFAPSNQLRISTNGLEQGTYWLEIGREAAAPTFGKLVVQQ